MQPTEQIWMSGRFVPWAEANVHVLTHGLHYGTGVFDSLRAYATSSGPVLVHHRAHHERLRDSAKLYGMELPFSVDELVDATRTLIASSGLAESYVRTIAFRGSGAMGVSPRNSPVEVAIATWGWGAYLGEEAMTRGIRAKISSWRRIGHGTHLPGAKATAHYLNSVLARVEAEELGFDEAILLDENGLLAEGSGENLFLVKDGVLLTPPLSSGALGGITRLAVLELAGVLGLPVAERALTRGELYLADELFMTGTAAEITPVREVDGRAIGSGSRGPVTQAVQTAYDDAVHGRDERFAGWLDVVR
ncbi:branched-chain amino acid transaminase [Conexibacter stalactiti]|uniref:Branched-chain-amino-acid aminotransferase n=1 Tax=Conexibacter stalactiti TaxID=1940611 RepID=A0ABU4HUI4_9ACTN|nr:branched-chain amino acid transaminase [Conexibacter stalactiti]MDW5595699.1 branched-chain amino acid transaminase [Conexibacter stalactiti]MEC5036341.1 branched-chain amino acid transaminase [Conexibacter stalactiti]